MQTLASFCREIYYGSTQRALRTRYAFLVFDPFFHGLRLDD